MKKVEDEVLPTFFKYMDTMLKDNGGNFFVGEKVIKDYVTVCGTMEPRLVEKERF